MRRRKNKTTRKMWDILSSSYVLKDSKSNFFHLDQRQYDNMCRCMNVRSKGVNDISALRASPTTFVWDLDDAAGSGSVEGTSDDHDQSGLYSSHSLVEATTPQGIHFLLEEEDSIRFHRSILAEGSRVVIAEHEASRFGGMRGIRPSGHMPMSQELDSLDLDGFLRSEEEDDCASVMTQDSLDFEEFEVDLNDEPSPLYRSVDGSCNFYRLALSLGLGNHDSGHSEANDDDSNY